MDEDDDEIMEEARRTIFNPEFLMAVALEKVNHPTMFISSWDDEGGVEPQPDIESKFVFFESFFGFLKSFSCLFLKTI